MERHSEGLFAVLPYLLLALPTVLSVARSDTTGTHRLTTVAGAMVVAVWILATYTLPRRAPARRGGAMTGYFVGLLAGAILLTAHDPLFVVFAVTIFLQAHALLPTGWALLFVAATSCTINTVPHGFPEPTVEAVVWYLTTIAVQTTVIGWLNLLSSRLIAQHAQRKQTVAELRAALTENAGLYAQLIAQAREAGVHDERQRMAGEIHDTLAQGLAGIILQLEVAQDAADNGGQWRGHLMRARDLARESLAEARRSVQALRPEPLEQSCLPDAIANMASTWSQGREINVDLETTGTAMRMHPELEATLFRVAQEALTNVGKHARASKVGITLSYMEDVVMLDVRDDGVGFDPGASAAQTRVGHGFGLAAMRRRLQRVAGTLEIESTPGEGTAISAGVPAIPQEVSA